jgi:arylsulfatase A
MTGAAMPALAAPGTLPDIVLTFAGDMGCGDPGYHYPESRISMPHLDRLAAGELRFTDAHTPSAMCTPTCYVRMTPAATAGGRG